MKTETFALILLAYGVLVLFLVLLDFYRTKRNGIEAEAVVTRAEKKWRSSAVGYGKSYRYTVKYRTTEGTAVSAELSGFGTTGSIRKFCCGDRILIKYLPNRPERPLYIKMLPDKTEN